jgi:hypothetical protein
MGIFSRSAKREMQPDDVRVEKEYGVGRCWLAKLEPLAWERAS